MEKYESAVQSHRAGRLSEAERLYRETVAEQPDHAQAWFLLSALAMGRSEDTVALSQLSRALELAPTNAAYHSNLGLLLRRLGRMDEAARALLHAIELEPNSVEANHNLGLVLKDQGNSSAALLCFSRVAELMPRLAVNQHQFALALVAEGQLRRALAHYHSALAVDGRTELLERELAQVLDRLGRGRHALAPLGPRAAASARPIGVAVSTTDEELLQHSRSLVEQGELNEANSQLLELVTRQPEWIEAILGLGTVSEKLGDLDAALLCFEQATDIDPRHALAQYRLASLLVTRGEFEIAIGHFHAAMNLEPDCVDFIAGLATVYHSLQRYAGSELLYRRALTMQPESARLHAELGMLLGDKGHCDQALELCDRAIALAPTTVNAWVGRALAMFDSGRVRDALLASKQALTLAPSPDVQSRHLYMMMYDPESSASDILQEARGFDDRYGRPLLPPDLQFENSLQSDRPLRIGFVSADFRSHCQSFFMLPLLQNLARDKFAVTCYSTSRQPDAVTERLKKFTNQWRDVAEASDAALARSIIEDRIDILFDLTMHMQGGRPLVFARKPAPIQATWLAYPGTTGLSAIDYRLTDSHLDPLEGVAEPYVEQSIQLPETFWCYDPLCSEPTVGPLPALETGIITFGCLNSFAKTNAFTFALWSQVLTAVERSRLILLAPGGSARDRTVREFEQLGIAAERIQFVDRQPRAKYLHQYRQIDICLDTSPYNGHTTSLDATWMGVPVVTLSGNTVVGRAGACLALNMQLPELIAHSSAEFVRKAEHLCSDVSRLAQLRGTLRERLEASPLMNAPLFARHFEAILSQMWSHYCGGQSAAKS